MPQRVNAIVRFCNARLFLLGSAQECHSCTYDYMHFFSVLSFLVF
eukprot:COSAG06_NODE_3431_length_5356_cov_5.474796_6_plen_45_part_00